MGAARLSIPSVLPFALGGAFALAGCRQHQAATAEPEQMEGPPAAQELVWDEKPLGGVAGRGASPVPVKEGAAPLVYLSEQAQAIRVIDRTSGQVLGESVVPARTVVSVDERKGVSAGRQVWYAGPLEKGRRYAIVVVPSDENVSRTGKYVPIEPPADEPAEQAEPVSPENQAKPGDSTGTSGVGGK
jgi:hypothetical protein